jgi:site-specific DNA-methyltransferase (adenine-specific)
MRNKLYFGDNLDILRRHIPDECIDLIYIDPPFNSNRNYFVLFKDRTGKASAAQEAAFQDTWTWTQDSEATYKVIITTSPNRDLATTIEALRHFLKESPMMSYLVAMSIRAMEMHRVLKQSGSFYLHCDPTASHYLKIALDTIFGGNNFRNEVIWKRTNVHSDSKTWSRVTDTILFYTKSAVFTWNAPYGPHSAGHIEAKYRMKDETGRAYTLSDMTSPNPRPHMMYEWRGYPYPKNGWRYSQDTMAKLDEEGRIWYPEDNTKRPRLKRYLDEMLGTLRSNCWTDISPINSQAAERLGYPTQKPLALLERIIRASSNSGDLVLDCYCGCGTSVTAAHKLGRQWIGVDITAVAVAIIKSRLENSFDDLKGKVIVDGFPTDIEGARQLFEMDPHRFQVWACTLIDAFPLTKKGADAGVDGWLNFLDLDETPQRAVVQVKGGKVQVAQVRDFCHVVQREKAAIGFFLCFGDVTEPMRTEAVKEGYWTDAGRHDFPKVQILTIADLLSGAARAKYPSQFGRSMLGYKARVQEQAGLQPDLFEEE